MIKINQPAGQRWKNTATCYFLKKEKKHRN